ncbi:hypothetical protein GT042_24900, partial [Streptomyces sp. SID3212]|nr:hypothetical protein [Streptomyces sp. SID3212]
PARGVPVAAAPDDSLPGRRHDAVGQDAVRQNSGRQDAVRQDSLRQDAVPAPASAEHDVRDVRDVRTDPDAPGLTPPQTPTQGVPSGRRRARRDVGGGADDSMEMPVQLDTGAMSFDPNGNQWGAPDADPGPAGGRSAQDQSHGFGNGPVANGQDGPATPSGFGPMVGPPGWPDDPRPAQDTAGGQGLRAYGTDVETGGVPAPRPAPD